MPRRAGIDRASARSVQILPHMRRAAQLARDVDEVADVVRLFRHQWSVVATERASSARAPSTALHLAPLGHRPSSPSHGRSTRGGSRSADSVDTTAATWRRSIFDTVSHRVGLRRVRVVPPGQAVEVLVVPVGLSVLRAFVPSWFCLRAFVPSWLSSCLRGSWFVVNVWVPGRRGVAASQWRRSLQMCRGTAGVG